jgi:hypothetical protein
MMKNLLAILVGTAIAGMAYAQQSPVDLAVESYKFIETSEMKLQGAINGGSKADYDRFIWKPTLEQFEKWPSMEKEQYNKYRPCQFALDSFRVYSEDQFKASGKLDKKHPQYRDFMTRKRECAALLKGKV